MSTSIGKALLSSVLAATTICAGAPPARAQSGGANGSAKGLKYWLAVDVAQVDVTVTTTTTTDYEITQAEGEGQLVLRTRAKVKRDGTLSARTIADRSAPTYSLDMPSGRMSDNGVSVTVNAGGLLESVSATSTGRGSQILTSIAKFVGSALSIAAGGALSPLRLTAVDVNALRMSAPDTEQVPEACDPYGPPFTTLPIRVRAFVAESRPGCLLFWQIRQADSLVSQLRGQRSAREGSLDTAPESALPDLRQRIKELSTAIGNNEKIQAELQARFNALFDAFVADKNLGTTSQAERFSVVLGLDEIPPDLSSIGLPVYAKVADLFRTTGVLVVGRPAAGSATGAAAGGSGKPADSGMVRIMFRQPAAWTLEVRSSRCNTADEACRNAPPTTANTQLQSLTPIDLIAPRTEPSYVELEAKAFGDGKVAMTFDKGRPLRLERSGTSSAASLAAAVSDAARNAQEQYAESLAKIVEIQKSKREIELSDVNTQIEKAKKQKDLLEAKLAAADGAQSFEMLLEQKRLDTELSLLRAEAGLQAAQDAADQRLEIEAIKVKVEQLKAQIDLLTVQKQYEAMTK
jgi:hypothetical protein